MNPCDPGSAIRQPIVLSDRETQWLAIARRAAQDSPDRSRKVGAVLIGKHGDILAATCNTLPVGLDHEDRYLTRPAKYDWTEHAERNAIYAAARAGRSTEGGCMVLPWFPRVDCARAIVQSGIHRVVAQAPDLTDPTWGPGFTVALELFQKAGVQFDEYVDTSPMPSARPEEHGVVEQEKILGPSLEETVDQWNQVHRTVVQTTVMPLRVGRGR